MNVKIYTDGGCSGNPGPGGWAYVIIAAPEDGAEEIIAEQWGAEGETTNNRMELSAAVEALKAAGNISPLSATLYTDSQYLQKGITGWIRNWKRNGWRTSSKEPVKNRDLWQQLDELSAAFPLRWQWVKGHAGDEYNERCDRMTQEAILSVKNVRP